MWSTIRVWFHDSETIVWARLQVVAGIVFTVIATTDQTILRQVVDALHLTRWWPILVVAAGIVTELVRRSRSPHDLGVSKVADLANVQVSVPPAAVAAVEQTIREKI